jgi:23S rRNA A1618 N6-methylase RlmF
MNLTKEQLDRVKDLAYRTMTSRVIANALEVDEVDFVDEVCTPGTPARQAYLSGMMQQMLETRESIIKAARNGSNPAQAELLRFLEKQLYSMDKF